jgi:hypothetical protein
MSDDLDLRDLLLEVEADVTELINDVMQELQLPQMKTALRVRWMTMPDEMKEQIAEEQPKLYEQIIRMIDEERSY